MRPARDEYSDFFAGYISLVPENDVLQVLEQQLVEIPVVWRGINESEATAIHAPYTGRSDKSSTILWTANESLVIDC